MTDSKSRCVVEILTDTRPIVYPTLDWLSTACRPTIDRQSTDCPPTTDLLSTDYRPTTDRLSTECRSTIDRLSINCRPTVDQLSTAISPISRWTLPTVNKIHNRYVNAFSRVKGYPTVCSLDSDAEAPRFMREIRNSSVFAKSASLIPHISFVRTYDCLCGSREPLESLLRDEGLNGSTFASDGCFAKRVGRRMTEQPNTLCFLNSKVPPK